MRSAVSTEIQVEYSGALRSRAAQVGRTSSNDSRRMHLNGPELKSYNGTDNTHICLEPSLYSIKEGIFSLPAEVVGEIRVEGRKDAKIRTEHIHRASSIAGGTDT